MMTTEESRILTEYMTSTVTEGTATASKSMSAVKTSKRINRFTNMPKFLKASDFEKAYMIR